MGLWPFGRKRNRIAVPEGPETSIMRSIGPGPEGSTRNDGVEAAGSSGPERRRSRRDGWGKRKSSRETKKLRRDPERRRTYSFSPGRNDSLRVLKDADRPPLPPLPANVKGRGFIGHADTSRTFSEKPVRAATQPVEGAQDWQRVPTLHKRAAQDLPRRKSSKKRKEDHDREAEIKAMAAFIPVRPAVESSDAGRPMKRERRSMRAGLNRNLQNPSSDISLPLAESIHSSLSSRSEHQTSYRLNPLDLLAPRPTIRYTENPRYGPATVPGARDGSRRRRISDRVAIPEETMKAHKRIDDLANDFDAKDLRELMERDQKRRERKKLAEKQKMEKKLSRRQEKQRADEAAAARNGTPPPPNLDRGVMGREVVGLGIGTSAVVTSMKRKGSSTSDRRREKRLAESDRQDLKLNIDGPFTNFQSNASFDQMTPGSEHSEAVVQTAKVGTMARASISPPASPRGHARGASSISQMMELNRGDAARGLGVPQKAEPPREQAERSGGRKSQSWTSFFKRSPKKQLEAPSSFSNTSRDSMLNAQGSTPSVGYTSVRAPSNIPKRTMSRFREDLPELPLSPPDSRVQSPEGDIVPPIRTDYQERRAGTRTSGDDPRLRYDTPTSGYRSLDDRIRAQEQTPNSAHRSAPSPEPVAIPSQSLASIDSEGSWLSGRPSNSKRGSARMIPKAESTSTLHKREREYSESAEELGIAEDEYFSRLSPAHDGSHRIHRQSTGHPVPSSDEEEDENFASPHASETKWGAAVARQPMVVHRSLRAKSREGLLNEVDDESGSEDPRGETPEDMNRDRYRFDREMNEVEEEGSGLQRATSVDLGTKHVRHISAGSARLLDLKPRPSGEGGKRISSG